jgi:ArsR family transcriptional regulator
MKIEATKLFGALANDTRLRCLMLLLHQDELCVCELIHALGASQPHVPSCRSRPSASATSRPSPPR